jgi:hypothetical protein
MNPPWRRAFRELVELIVLSTRTGSRPAVIDEEDLTALVAKRIEAMLLLQEGPGLAKEFRSDQEVFAHIDASHELPISFEDLPMREDETEAQFAARWLISLVAACKVEIEMEALSDTKSEQRQGD